MKQRQRERWNPETPPQTLNEKVRRRCCLDLKYMVQEVLCHGNADHRNNLGYLHDVLCDYLRWEEDIPDNLRHSSLYRAVAEMREKGHNEVWVHWPVFQLQSPDGPITKKPDVYFGRDHKIYRDWVSHAPIYGVLVRMVGNGKWKAVLIPRNHLKSTFARAEIIQDIVRDSASRTMFRTAENALATTSVSAIKDVFEHNPEFKKYFGDLKPDYKDDLWSKGALRVVSNTRRGVDPTVWAAALTTDVVGFRPEKGVLDDVVNKKNLRQQDQIEEKFQEFIFNLDNAHNQLRVWGTRHQDDDLYGRILFPQDDRDDAELEPFDYMSFMYGTLKDTGGEASGVAKGGYIWPEGFTAEVEKQKGAALTEHQKNCQWYNNPYMLSNRKFKDDWLRYYDLTPEAMAVKHRYFVKITIDPAHKDTIDSDFTVAMVQGQTPDRTQRDVLDGFRERLPFEQIPIWCMDLIEKWLLLCRKNGLDLQIAIEGVAGQAYLKYGLRDEAMKRGLAIPEIKFVEPKSRGKDMRIATLIPNYSAGVIGWPRTLMRTSFKGAAYDFIVKLHEEYTKWPNSTWDDCLDCQAYGEDLFEPMLFKEAVQEAAAPVEFKPDVQTRAMVETNNEYGGRFVPERLRARPQSLQVPGGMRSR